MVRRSALANAFAATLLALGVASWANAMTLETWLAEKAAWYDAHPALKTTPGSGWKPYNRARWDYERSLYEGAMPTPAQRWAAIEARLARQEERAYGDWFCAGPAELSGRILDIAFDPTDTDIVYVGAASGGLWKSSDRGATWSTTTDQLAVLEVGAVEVLPWSHETVLLGSGEGNGAGVWGLGLLRSTDGGATWQQTSLNYALTDGHGFNAIATNPLTQVILAAARDALWRSTDDGATWTAVAQGLFYDVVWSPDATRVYAVRGDAIGQNGVFVSTDDGLTFDYAGVGQAPGTQIGNSRLAVSAAAPDWVYVNYTNRGTSETLGVYRSTDGGATWEARNTSLNMTGGQGWYNVTLAVDPDDADRLVAGGVRLYRSVDGGASFSITGDGNILGDESAVHVDHHAAVYVPGASDELWVGSDGGVWRSLDDGLTWASRREGLVTYQFYDIGVAQTDPLFMMGGTQDNGVPGRTDPDSWFASTLLADGMVTCVSALNANHVYSEWQFGNHVRSYDGGQNWTTIMNGIYGSGAWVTPMAASAQAPSTVFTSTSAGIFRTESGGTVWTNVAPHTATWIAVSPVDPQVVWTIAGNSPRLSTDGGDTWSLVSAFGFPTPGASKILPHPAEREGVLVVFYSYADVAHVAVSHDLGASWENASGDLPLQPVRAVAVDPLRTENWFIGTDTGVWHSADAGAHWLPCGAGLPIVRVMDLEINGYAHKLLAGTYGRGAWELDLDAVTAAGGPEAVAPGLLLDAPFPNPVRGDDGATFRFASRRAEGAALAVYDVRGRRVNAATPVPGDGIIRTLRWTPGELPSGVYFAVLQAGDARVTRKLTLSR